MATGVAVPRLADLREAARAVLLEHRRLMPYAELAAVALERLEYPRDSDTLTKAKEDLREKILLSTQQGFTYTGKPRCLAGLSRWTVRQRTLIHERDRVIVPLRWTTSLSAAQNANRRLPHVLNKANDGPERHFARLLKGLIIEEHVSEWFRSRWPLMWWPPVNANDPRQPCAHDFRMYLPATKQTIAFDVASVSADGQAGVRRGGKTTTDIHVIAEQEEHTVEILGFVGGSTFASQLWSEEATQPLELLEVMLNSESRDLPYLAIRREANA